MSYRLVIKPEVFDDIQDAVEWYNSRQAGLGRKFFQAVQLEWKTLKTNPGFQVRYDQIRCLPIKRFPFMIHYYVHEEAKTVVVIGLINTFRNPGIWKTRKKG